MAYNSEEHSEIFLNYQILISMIGRNFRQACKNSVHVVQSYLRFSKIQGGAEPYVHILFKLCQKLRPIMLIKI